MGQKKNNKLVTWVVVALVIAVIAMSATFFSLSTREGANTATGETIGNAIGESQFCANNPQIDAKVRIRDNLATSKSYLNGTILVQNKDTGSIVEKEITSGGTTDFTELSNLFECKSKEGYKIYVKADGTLNSDGMFDVTPDMLSTEPVELTMEASQYSPLKIKGYDNVEKAKILDDTGSTDYSTADDTVFNDTGAGSSWSTDASDVIDVTFTLAPQTSAEAKGKGMYILINTEDESNLDDIDESLSEVYFDGVKLSQATGLSENELRAVNSYELIYKVDGTVGMDAEGAKDTQSELRVMLESEADAINKSFDPVIKFVALGDYESTDTDEVLTDIGFKDDSSRTELYTAQTATIVVGAVGANN